MIDDIELRGLFKDESESHLQSMEDGLLRLEDAPHDRTVLDELFRSAHTLKGAAQMLGVDDVETLAHLLEDELGAARRGQLVLSSTAANRLYCALDAMKRLSREACGGETAQVDMPRVLAQLRGDVLPDKRAPKNGKPPDGVAVNSPDSIVSIPMNGSPDNDVPATPPYINGSAGFLQSIIGPANEHATPPQGPDPMEANLKSNETVLPVVPAALPPAMKDSEARPLAAADESQPAVSPSTFTIDTIRVEPHKLDTLMTLAGEMTVTTTRVARSVAVIDDLVTLSEEWGRDERGGLERMGRLLGQLKRTGAEDITRLGRVASELDEAIRNMRLLPFSTIFNLFPRLVRDLSKEQDKEVRLVVEGGTIAADKHLLEEMKDPLMHMIRNAIDHGIELPGERERQGKTRAATLRLSASQTAAHITIEIADDGRGLDVEAIRRTALRARLPGDIAAMSAEEVQRLIFAPGFSTSALITDVSGRGVGLDVVRTNVDRLKGTLAVESVPGRGCTFRLEVPVTLSTTRVLLVQVARWSYAIPVAAVQIISLVSPKEIFSIEGRSTISVEGLPIPVARLADLLELPAERTANPSGKENKERGGPERLLPYILLNGDEGRLGIFVDALLDEQEVVLKPFGGMLQRVRNVSGATVLGSGEICMVLNPQDLIKSAQKAPGVGGEKEMVEEVIRKKVLLLVEDSITTRTQEKRILESAGYEVVTAVNGVDGFNKLSTRLFDGVVSDIEMPEMDGLALTARIREDAKYKELPIILVTSLASDADRKRGIEVGANAYITKGTFEQTAMLDTLGRLL